MSITFFTHTRPFEGEFDRIQRTAMDSWRTAVPGCQVVAVNDHVEHNEEGTALVSSIFEQGERLADHELLCEISSDIVLGGDFAQALDALEGIERPFVVGQRLDIDPGAPPESAELHPPSAVDYFIYRRGTLGQIPPFAVGRTAYDQWLVWAAVRQWGLTVIDATETITAIHLNHGHPEYGTKEKMIQSEERQRNYQMVLETGAHLYGTNNAPWVMNAGKVTRR